MIKAISPELFSQLDPVTNEEVQLHLLGPIQDPLPLQIVKLEFIDTPPHEYNEQEPPSYPPAQPQSVPT
jgi:hypothetical protein